MSRRVGFVGSRTFTDRELMEGVLAGLCWREYEYGSTICVVSGGAVGADTIAAECARAEHLELVEYLPDRDKYGWPAAAFVRNQTIVDDVTELFAFYGPGTESPGTTDTINKARRRRIPVHIYYQNGEMDGA